MSEEQKSSTKRKRSTFGVVFLIIFLDMVGFSVIFPLFPDMLDYYLERESEGGILKSFVSSIEGMSFDADESTNQSFRFEVTDPMSSSTCCIYFCLVDAYLVHKCVGGPVVRVTPRVQVKRWERAALILVKRW